MEILKEMLENSDFTFNTLSDARSVQIGNEACTMFIPNGGEKVAALTKVIIYDSLKPINLKVLKYVMRLEGKFDIFNYDCCKAEMSRNGINRHGVCYTLDGDYLVYNCEVFVVFMKVC